MDFLQQYEKWLAYEGLEKNSAKNSFPSKKMKKKSKNVFTHLCPSVQQGFEV